MPNIPFRTIAAAILMIPALPFIAVAVIVMPEPVRRRFVYSVHLALFGIEVVSGWQEVAHLYYVTLEEDGCDG